MQFRGAKNAKVLILDASSSARMEISGTLRRMGFEAVVQMASVSEVRRHLGARHQVDWIVTGLMAAERENALYLLHLLNKNPQYGDIVVSLLLEPEEQSCLPVAFEMGLLSWHQKQLNRQHLTQQFTSFLETTARCQFNSSLIAADYLRRYLATMRLHDALLACERAVVKAVPEHPPSLIRLAEAEFLNGQPQRGRECLARALKLDEKVKDEVATLHSKYVKATEAGQRPGGTTGSGQLRNLGVCVVVDPDTASSGVIRNSLKEMGASEVLVFEDGQRAWDWIKHNAPPSLIIQEWRIPNLSGAKLLQRLRASGQVDVPVLVASSLLKSTDTPLLTEIGVSQVLSKPFSKQVFHLAVAWAIQQHLEPTETRARERRMVELLKIGKTEAAKKIRAEWLQDKALSPVSKDFIEGEFAYYEGRYEAARDHAVSAMKQSTKTSLRIVSLLGRALMKLKDFQGAVKCFHLANSLSPENISYLCFAAEAHLEMGDRRKAEQNASAALALDDANEMALQTTGKVLAAKGDFLSMVNYIAQMANKRDIFAYLNNQAVALIKGGDVQQGYDYYRKAKDTLKQFEAELPDVAAIIDYNWGLGYVREGKLAEALSHFQQAMKFKGSPVQRKVGSIARRIQECIDEKKPFTLKSDQGAPDEFDDADMFESLTSEPVPPPTTEFDTNSKYWGLRTLFQSPVKVDAFTAGLLSASTTVGRASS